MGRPSLKETRKKQILEAASTLAARNGLGGLTLESIAKQANMARPLVRHNLGNREEIIDALVIYFVDKSERYLDEYRQSISKQSPLTDLVKMLFDPKYSDTEFNLLGNALVMEGANNESIRKSMETWTIDFIQFVEDCAKQEFPDSRQENRRRCAVGISGIFFSVESMLVGGDIEGFRDGSLQSALYLITALED